jgi:site-specific DNA-methyltransferase (adenine-specific)
MRLELGDCLEVLKTIPDNSVDSIVTDPPYGLSFMNKKWDYDVPSTDIWIECLRVLKPGGHLLSFSGSRTYHRMAVRIEDAGFDIRDQIMWVYGSGFPKSHNIGKAVDKLLGNEREVVGPGNSGRDMTGGSYGNQSDKEPMTFDITKGTSEWEGWGTALKPSHEPIVMARKPLSEKTVAENVLRWGTGGLNINVSRIGTDDNLNGGAYSKGEYNTDGKVLELGLKRQEGQYEQPQGRWPANIIFECTCDELIDGKEIKGNENYNFNNTNTSSNTFTNRGKYTPRTETPKIHTNPNCPCYILDQQSGISTGKVGMTQQSSPNNIYQGFKSKGDTKVNDGKTDKGGASRYFLNVKVDTEDFFMYIYNKLNELLCGNILENQQVVTTLSGVIKEVEKCIVKQGQYTIGSLSMDQFQKDTISIISTLTELMTELKIYNSLQRVNTDFYTQELGKTINKLMELNTENVSVVETINHLMDLTLEMVEHIKVIVKNVEELNYKNGGKQIGNITTNTTGNIEKSSRFFYCPKASKKDRDEGLDGFENKTGSEITGRKECSAGLVMEDDKQNPFAGKSSPINKNHHPTVKPTALMLYLIKLVTPVNGTVLDCFLGSGSTGKAAIRGGFDFIGIEREEEYIKIAEARIKNEIHG